MNPAGLPGASNWLNANLATIYNNPTFQSTFYEYWKNTASGIDVVGLYNSLPQVGVNVVTDVTSTGNIFFPTPLNYGDNYNYTRREVYDAVSTSGTIPTSRRIQFFAGTITCDAWGTLTTPSQTANVLRFKEKPTSCIDSSFIEVTAGNFIFTGRNVHTLDSTCYTFFKKGPGMRMLYLYANNTTGLIHYQCYYNAFPTGVTETANASAVQPFPNPASDQITFVTDGRSENTLIIYDLSGRIVFNYEMSGVDKLSIDLSGLPNGMYIYKLGDQNESPIKNGRLVVQHK